MHVDPPQGETTPDEPPDDGDNSRLRRLFELASGPGTAEELQHEHDIVAAMLLAARTVAGGSGSDELSVRRARRVPKLATRVAIIAVGALVGASTAAAAGVLPDSAQSVIARATAHVGLRLPDPGNDRAPVTSAPTPSDAAPDVSSGASTTDAERTASSTSPPTEPGAAASTTPATPGASTASTPNASVPPAATAAPDTTTTASATAGTTTVGPTLADGPPVGPDATGPAKDGLCRAWDAHRRNGTAKDHSVAMQQLDAAARDAGVSIEQYCADVLGTPTSSEVTTTAPSPTTTADENVKGTGQKKDESKKNDKGKLASPDST